MEQTKSITKPLLAVMLSLAMVFSLVQGGIFTASAETSGDYEYEVLENGTVEITDYYGSETELTIPSTLDGKTVTSIGDGAFSECSSLESIEIPDSVESIGDAAFYGTEIYNTDSNWENGLLYIDNYLIAAKKEDISGEVKIKEGTKIIADNVFWYCSALTDIVIPDSVESIGGSAFQDCTSLTSVTIGNGVKSIGDYAFYYCASLTSVEIPNSVESIGDGAFRNCSALTDIVIPDSVKSIGYIAFAYCSSLTDIVIPDSVESIGDYAFNNCPSLTNVLYGGTKEQWEKITIGTGNESLTDVTRTYCEHNKKVPDDAVDPTCEKTGKTAGEHCSECGKTFEIQKLAALGHSFTNYESNNDATCTADGTKTAVCDREGCEEKDTKADEGSALKHSFTDYESNNDATCTEDGTKTATCDREGCEEKNTKTDEGSALGGHSFTTYESDNNATCTEDGTKTAVCDRDNCDETNTVTDEDSALGHDTQLVQEKEATCTEDGNAAYYTCSGCDKWFDDAEATEGITDKSAVVKSAKGHTEVTDKAVAPSCDKTGLTEGKHCSVCNGVLVAQKEVAKTEHKNIVTDKAVAATCEETGKTEGKYCKDCGAKIKAQTVVKAKGHSTTVKNQKSATYFAKGYSGDTYCNTCKKVVKNGIATAKKTLKTPKVKVTKGKKQFKVKYTKVSGATGFQVQYKKGKKTVTKTISTKKSVTRAITKLAKGTYKVKVRALVKSGKKKAYSKWTKTYSVKVRG